MVVGTKLECFYTSASGRNSPARFFAKISEALNKKLGIFSKILAVYDGKDKSLKLVQYFLKILLDFDLIRPGVNRSNVVKTTKDISDARKIFRLGRPIESLQSMRNAVASHIKSTSADTTFHLIYSVVEGTSNILDDFGTLVKLFSWHSKSIDLYWVPFADENSILAWWITLHMDLYSMLITRRTRNAATSEEHQEESTSLAQFVALRHRQFLNDPVFRLHCISILKVLSDYLFCAVEYTNFLTGKTASRLRTLSGFSSAACSFYKIYHKNK